MRIAAILPAPRQWVPYIDFARRALESSARAAHMQVFEWAGPVRQALPENSLAWIYDRQPNRLLRSFWLQYTLPAMVKRMRCDVVLFLQGGYMTHTAARQLTVIPFVPGQTAPAYEWQKFSSAYLQKLARSGAALVIPHPSYMAPAEALTVHTVFPGGEGTPAGWEERELAKLEIAGGHEFFFSDLRFASTDDFIRLLKGYSVFKKWQQSSMQLVVLCSVWQRSEWQQKLATYKFRSDVRLTDTPHADQVACSYAVVEPQAEASLPLFAQAAASRVPVLSPALATVAPEGAFLPAGPSAEETGQALITIYKDEALRSRIITQAEAYVQQPAHANGAQRLWSLVTGVNGQV